MRLAMIMLLGSTIAASAAPPQHYRGICEPSGGAFLDAAHFAVASDESNIIRIYRRGSADPVSTVDLRAFLGHDKSDIEGAARGDGVIYWTASQSSNSNGRDKKRKVLFRTEISGAGTGGAASLRPVGIVREDLKDHLVRLSGAPADAINVEGLAATPDGGLLFGLRNLVDGKAAVVRLRNADAVLAGSASAPAFGATARLDLGGRGIRSLERVKDRYLIVAGKPTDGAGVGYALFWWDGEPGHPPEPLARQPDFSGLDPEIVMPLPDGSGLQIISDDGDRCARVDDEHADAADRGFSSIDLPY